MIDLMIDIEGMGALPPFPILSIGAVFFDRATGQLGQQFYVNIDCVSQQDLNWGGDTINWWLQQSKAAQAALFEPKPINIGTAMGDLLLWVKTHRAGKLNVWSHATYDAVAIHAVCKHYNLRHPWHYRDDRDIRTLQCLAGKVTCERTGTHHNALDDALFQADYVSKMLQQANTEGKV